MSEQSSTSMKKSKKTNNVQQVVRKTTTEIGVEEEDEEVVDNSWRKSFDRFGDDLAQLLLSYLSICQRFRCECVSKQWQQVIYELQTLLDTNDDELFGGQQQLMATNHHRKQPIETIETVLNKCPNITYIYIDMSKPFVGKLIELIAAKNCQNLDKLYTITNYYHLRSDPMIPSVNTLDNIVFDSQYYPPFRPMHGSFYGNKADKFSQQLSIQPINSYLNTVTYVKQNNLFSIIFANHRQHDYYYLRQLKSIYFNYSLLSGKNYDNFVDNCANSLLKLHVVINAYTNVVSLKRLMTGLSRMTLMNDLLIENKGLPIIGFGDQLKLIGQHCRQLRRLALDMNIGSVVNADNNTNNNNILTTINQHFGSHLRCLEFAYNPSEHNSFDCLTLDQMKQLRRLSYYRYDWHLRDNSFFVKLVHQLPRLVCLSNTRRNGLMSSSTTTTTTTPKFKKSYLFSYFDKKVTQLSQLLDNKSQLKCIEYNGNRYLLKYRP
ncbi:uncharacterized protein LOC128952640 [Oppia nitens]|uniref:uncharacterized protein LOC128952640 n=1 Tax=Oppia nitens TaxID=1686743 RepID=UPI0023DB5B72|nr:uncharacterized protein LOC128952640 [Oppia nitens]XP_054154039.1 uncharacterized protein LOC128952640 [Oppia nitens]XP_054154040.1 uncharacterized protein LOC128952640 [Oppia nitens]